MTTKELIALIESLPRHNISGYEWECDGCDYNWDVGHYQDTDGNNCDHARLIDLDLLIRKVSA